MELGTSDIAICRDGSIFAYGMVPMAGDEITENICDNFLLTFDEAERIKRELTNHQMVKFTDILGMKGSFLKGSNRFCKFSRE